ncbi:cache domain-containing protein [Gulosibacter sp. GYB002]|uniref:cache domain-containing protein n=1 Tax=Gulosibacter sp. GYB002 TaxID=2994391 RepID=UPI002F961894
MTTIDTIAGRIALRFDEAYRELASLAANIEQVLEQSLAAPDEPFTREQATQFQHLAGQTLERLPLAKGAGFVVAHTRTGQRDQALQWRVRTETGSVPYLLIHAVAPAHVYEYRHLSWYIAPAEYGCAGFTGPYFDFLCANQLTLTLSTPVFHHGEFAGVTACDIDVPDAERALLQACGDFSGEAALTNAEGQVICSTTASWLPGDRMDARLGIAIDDGPTRMRVVDISAH